MKKFFLFAVAIASLSLVSCNGDNNQSNASGSSVVDPNAPSQQVPQDENASVSAASVSNLPSAAAVEEGVNKAGEDAAKAANELKEDVKDAKKDLKEAGEKIVNDGKKVLDNAKQTGEKIVNDGKQVVEDGKQVVKDLKNLPNKN
ncbi:MAG: hypothetical protein IKT03_06015 [Muribaculaceae bacterium]|nr:hypothetical protein [Muribaculaceae bacterium]